MDLPDNVYIAESKIPGAGLGAFAASNIEKHTVLGDYTGRECSSEDDGDYVLYIQGYDHKGREVEKCIDAADPKTSGWPRFLNSIKKGDGQVANCKFFINKDKISVKAIAFIRKGQELLVDYGHEYF
jgi:SET domain-containing protein